MIASLLDNYPDCFCIPINQNQLLPQFISKSIDEVIVENSNINTSFICDSNSFSAFHLKSKILAEKSIKPFKHVNIQVSPMLRIKFILCTWFSLGIPSDELVAGINQLINSQAAMNENLLDSYNTFNFFNHIVNTVRKNFAVLFPNEPHQNIPAKAMLFMMALAIVIAFDRADVPCTDKNFDLEKLLLSDIELNNFFEYVFDKKVNITDLDYQKLMNSKKISLDMLHRFNNQSWENWQSILLNFYLNEQNINIIENQYIPSQYLSLLAKLNLVNKKEFIFVKQFLYLPSVNIYYWLVPVIGLEAVSKKECIIDQEKIKFIKEKNARLLLDLSGEALTYDEHTHREWVSIISILQEADIPPEKVYLLCSNYQLANHYSQWSKQMNVNYPIKLMGNNYYLYSHAHALLNDHLFISKRQEIISLAKKNVDENTLRPHYFMCLNLKERVSRHIILLFLLDRNYLEKGIVTYFGRESLSPEQPRIASNKNIHLNNVIQFVKNIPGEEKILSQIDKLEEMFPIVYDIPHNGTLAGEWPLTQIIPELTYYGGFKQIDSYFEIVTETYFTDETTLYLTEKTVRPILRFQLFIIVGSPFSLRYLRSRGFQTFAPYIDESYDEITDPVERMSAIMKEIDRLCRLDKKELHDIYCQLWPRVLHNFELYTQKISHVGKDEADELFELLAT